MVPMFGRESGQSRPDSSPDRQYNSLSARQRIRPVLFVSSRTFGTISSPNACERGRFYITMRFFETHCDKTLILDAGCLIRAERCESVYEWVCMWVDELYPRSRLVSLAMCFKETHCRVPKSPGWGGGPG